MRAFIRSFGAALPTRVVPNAELAPLLGVDPDWILKASGIEERRYADTADTVPALATAAAQDCLTRANLPASDLGMILCASGSPDRFCPGPASLTAAALGLTSTPALDLPIASAGSLAALVLAARLAPSTGPILVLGSEIMSRRVSLTPEGKDTALLFGDGAGAALVTPDPTAALARIADSCLYTDGTMADALYMQHNLLHMDGAAIIRAVSRKLPQAIATLLERHALPADAIGTFLLHQANLNLIARVAKTLDVPTARCFTNIARYGNTSSASMLIAAAEWHALQPTPAIAAPILFAAFGVGLNWGALLALPPGEAV
jgi:3-oxoacyl-[acyl-carrier-protein] synthase-3